MFSKKVLNFNFHVNLSSGEPSSCLRTGIEGCTKGGIEMTGTRGRGRRKLLDNLKEGRGHSYVKEEALDRTMWRASFGRGFGLVVRQTAK
jgi:hypothetical protein